MKKYVILIIVLLCSCARDLNFDARLDIGMTKFQAVEAMGEMPREIMNSSSGDSYVYHYYDDWAGWLPKAGTRILVFNAAGILVKWFCWGLTKAAGMW